jgi:hypothetical protein
VLFRSVSAAAAARPCYQHALEEMLASVVGDQQLYRSGGTIRTTLEKSLQNELNAWEGGLPDWLSKPSGPVLVVTQGGQIRAIVCAGGREADLRSKLGSFGTAWEGYEVSALSPGSVTAEQIVLPSGAGQK